MAEERPGSEELDEELATARSWVRWARERPAQLLSLAGLVFAVLKLLAVSKFSPATALALATSAGPGQVLLGAILLGYPLLLTALAAGTLTQILVELHARPARRIWPLILVSLVALAFLDLVMAGVLLAPFLYLLLPALFPGLRPKAVRGATELARGRASLEGLRENLAPSLHQWLETEQDPERRAKAQAMLDKVEAILDPGRERREKPASLFVTTRLLTWVPPAVVFLVLTSSPQMWLPPEIVQIEDHRIVAYVVSTEGRWTTLLREKDRAILRTKSDLVSGRQICGLPSTLRTPSLVQWVARADAVKLPPCFP